jgi:putative metalloprotease
VRPLTVWEKMAAASDGNSSWLSGFLSTHPVQEDRIADLKKIMPEALEYYKNPARKP